MELVPFVHEPDDDTEPAVVVIETDRGDELVRLDPDDADDLAKRIMARARYARRFKR